MTAGRGSPETQASGIPVTRRPSPVARTGGRGEGRPAAQPPLLTSPHGVIWHWRRVRALVNPPTSCIECPLPRPSIARATSWCIFSFVRAGAHDHTLGAFRRVTGTGHARDTPGMYSLFWPSVGYRLLLALRSFFLFRHNFPPLHLSLQHPPPLLCAVPSRRENSRCPAGKSWRSNGRRTSAGRRRITGGWRRAP